MNTTSPPSSALIDVLHVALGLVPYARVEVGDAALRQAARVPLLRLWLGRVPRLMERLPPLVREQVLLARRRVAATTAQRQRELELVLHALSLAGVESVFLKNTSLLISPLYPESALRPLGELDLWIPPAAWRPAVQALQRLDYRVLGHAFPSPLPSKATPLVVKLSPRWPGGAPVFLFTHPFQSRWVHLIARVSPQEMWTRRRISHRHPPHALLAPEDRLLHLLTHATLNLRLGHPLIAPLVDARLLLRAHTPDWTQVVHRAMTWHLRTAVWVGLHALERLFPGSVPRPVFENLRLPAWQRRLLRAFRPPPEHLLMPAPVHRLRRDLLTLALCDSPVRWPRVFLSRFTLPKRFAPALGGVRDGR